MIVGDCHQLFQKSHCESESGPEGAREEVMKLCV